MTALRELLAEQVVQQEAELVERVLFYVTKNKFLSDQEDLAEICQRLVRALNRQLLQHLDCLEQHPAFGPGADYCHGVVAKFAGNLAKWHKDRGVALSLYLGLLVYLRQSYLELAKDSDQADLIFHFFDYLQICTCTSWTSDALNRDHLTGLLTRHCAEVALNSMDLEENWPLSVIVSDVNGLKLINNAFGSSGGDARLKRLGRAFKHYARHGDIAARWGEDEFILIMPQTDRRTAVDIAHRISVTCHNGEFAGSLSISLAVETQSRVDQSLSELLLKAEKQMYRNKLLEEASVHGEIITSFLNTLKERSLETEEHSVRLQSLVCALGKELGLGESSLNDLKLLASLHDIGKIGVPDAILNKVGKLNAADWEVIRKHSEIGSQIVQATAETAYLAEAVLYHHERWDGSGYPHGLKGEEIPLYARVLAVVDAFDVMTNPRVYKGAMRETAALQEIIACAGTQFDPAVVDAFVKLAGEWDLADGFGFPGQIA